MNKSTLESPLHLMSDVPVTPEEDDYFRMAQLLLLLEGAEGYRAQVLTVDRIAYLDFFAANPFIVVSDGDSKSEQDRLVLKRAGFLENQLSYASAGSRFMSRRRKVQSDMARLVALGLVRLSAEGYRLTSLGGHLASQLVSVYADAYRESLSVVLRRIGSLTLSQLATRSQNWIGRSWLLIDLLADVSADAATVEGA